MFHHALSQVKFNVRKAAGLEDYTVTVNSITFDAHSKGTLNVTASWTATKGNYTENIENMTCDVNLVAGKINNISTTLSGNAKEIVFNVGIAPWTDNNQVVEFPTEKIYSFCGPEIAPGPLMYEGVKYVIKNKRGK